MKKQSGFTLIELMVVMAIIAILATAGLSAYTGYIRKARDTTRIADIAAINTIALGMISTSGSSPSDAAVLTAAMTDANNGQAILDPQNGKALCIGDWDDTTAAKVNCGYRYIQCDSGNGFSVGTKFESSSNQPLYQTDDIGGTTTTATAGTGTTLTEGSSNANTDLLYYEIGSCQTYCQAATGGCTLIDWTTI